jgi:hypothetical protein
LIKDEADELKRLICSVAEHKSYCVLALEEVKTLWMDSFFLRNLLGVWWGRPPPGNTPPVAIDLLLAKLTPLAVKVDPHGEGLSFVMFLPLCSGDATEGQPCRGSVKRRKAERRWRANPRKRSMKAWHRPQKGTVPMTVITPSRQMGLGVVGRGNEITEVPLAIV